MTSFRYKFFILVIGFSLSVLGVIDERIKNTLDAIDNHLKEREVSVSELIDLEHITTVHDEATETDKQNFLELANNFLTILEHENYLFDYSTAKWCLSISGAATAGISYGLSWLKLLKPECLIARCSSGYFTTYHYRSDQLLCAPNEVAHVCLQEIIKSGIKNIGNYTRYSKECFVGLDPVLEGEFFQLGATELVKSKMCDFTTSAALSLPYLAVGSVACGLLVGGGVIMYNDFSKNRTLKNIYTCSKEYPEGLIERIRHTYPKYTALISFIEALLIQHDETVNQTWGLKDGRHQCFKLNGKSSKSH